MIAYQIIYSNSISFFHIDGKHPKEFQSSIICIVILQKGQNNVNCFIISYLITSVHIDQGELEVDYDKPNLNSLICDLCKKIFDNLD